MKILIADDCRLSRHVLERPLAAWGYDVVSTHDGAEAWAALREPDGPRLAVLDRVMPGLDGLEVCRRVREQAQEPYVYLVLLTAMDRKADLIAGLDAGADDYLSKPFDVHELRVRLRAASRLVTLQTELVAAREQLRFQATHDTLTGAPNRAAVDLALERELGRSGRDGKGVAVAMLDLDHFKRINDTHGHAAGDAVLREVSRRITGALRGHDVVGRYGGEEFLVVLPGCDAVDAATTCERIRAAIAARSIPLAGGGVDVTASLGVAVGSRDATAKGLVLSADAALYRAKRAGRDRVELDAPMLGLAGLGHRQRPTTAPPPTC